MLNVDHLGTGQANVSLLKLIFIAAHRVKLAYKDVSNRSEHIRKSMRCRSGGPVRCDNQAILLLAVLLLLLGRGHFLITSRLEFLLRLLGAILL